MINQEEEPRFNPILPMSVPYMIIPMENYKERKEELRVVLEEHIELKSAGNDIPTDFHITDNDYRYEKNKFFSEFFEKEIKLISKQWFNYCCEIRKMTKGHVDAFYIYQSNDLTYDPKLDDMILTASWVEQANTFQQHFPHDHGTDTFACVFYWEYDEEYHEPLNMISPMKYVDSRTYQFIPKIKAGDILVIPGNIVHYTRPNMNVKPRTVVAFNLALKRFLNHP